MNAPSKALQLGPFDLRAVCFAIFEDGEPDAPRYFALPWAKAAIRRSLRATHSGAFDPRHRESSRAFQKGFASEMVVGSLKRLAELLALHRESAASLGVKLRESANALIQFLSNGESNTLEAHLAVSQSEVAAEQSNLTIAESEDFHLGAAAAARMLSGRNKRNDATAIYLLMGLAWERIEQMPSLETLHAFLCEYLGPNRVGPDIGRLAQICRKVGKRFKNPGRPKTSSAHSGS